MTIHLKGEHLNLVVIWSGNFAIFDRVLTLFFAIIGEDVLVELRQHDDYVSGKENLERFWVVWFLKFDVLTYSHEREKFIAQFRSAESSRA